MNAIDSDQSMCHTELWVLLVPEKIFLKDVYLTFWFSGLDPKIITSLSHPNDTSYEI